MGATAVRQAAQILDHVETIVAIELLGAAQGVDFRRQVMGQEKMLGTGTAVAYDLIRQHIPFLTDDTVLAPLIEQVRLLVADGTIKSAVEAVLGSEK
jgi:histidine ammonia-lyase